MMNGIALWRYRRKFQAGGIRGLVIVRASTAGLLSELHLNDLVVATDVTPLVGPDAVRNHLLRIPLADGSTLEVEVGYVSAVNVGIAVRQDGVLVHESHPGRKIAFPEQYREAALSTRDMTLGEAIRQGFREGLGDVDSHYSLDLGVFRRNIVPIAVDLFLCLLFFVVAHQTDLTTAAVTGAAAGLLLLVIQWRARIDLLGGLALFGTMLLILSALLAVTFQSEDAVKYRSSIVGLVSAILFFVDGMAGGNRLAIRLMRYLPYRSMDARRLGIGMGVMGIALAGINVWMARLASTNVWLFYTTFADFAVAGVLCLLVFSYAQGRLIPNLRPRYQPTQNAP